jgi:hypothetical protein
MQDMFTVYAERTIGSKVVLETPEEECDVGHVESHFGLFEDSVSIGAR